MTYLHNTAQNVQTLANALPHMSTRVANAWLLAEGQSVNNPTNPLNILYYGTSGQTGRNGRFATYASPAAGLQAAAKIIKTLSYYSGVRAALVGGNDHSIAKAIELSPWAAGHYGATATRPGSIERFLGLYHPTPAPVTTWISYVVKPGDNLSSIASKYHTTWQVIYSANRATIGSNPSLIHPGEVLHIPTHR